MITPSARSLAPRRNPSPLPPRDRTTRSKRSWAASLGAGYADQSAALRYHASTPLPITLPGGMCMAGGESSQLVSETSEPGMAHIQRLFGLRMEAQRLVGQRSATTLPQLTVLVGDARQVVEALAGTAAPSELWVAVDCAETLLSQAQRVAERAGDAPGASELLNVVSQLAVAIAPLDTAKEPLPEDEPSPVFLRAMVRARGIVGSPATDAAAAEAVVLLEQMLTIWPRARLEEGLNREMASLLERLRIWMAEAEGTNMELIRRFARLVVRLDDEQGRY